MTAIGQNPPLDYGSFVARKYSDASSLSGSKSGVVYKKPQ